MISFDFQPRTRVVFGVGSVAGIGDLARELGFRRTLLVADAGLVQAGYVAAAVRALDTAGIAAIPFHDFGQNPYSATVEAGRRVCGAARRSTRSSASAAAARSIAPKALTSC